MAWRNIDKNSASQIRDFLKVFPASHIRPQAEDQLKVLALRDWQSTDKASIEQLTNYLTTYPDSPIQAEVHEAIGGLAARRWKEYGNKSTPKELQIFIQDFPDTEPASEAKKRLADLEQEANNALTDFEATFAGMDQEALTLERRRFLIKYEGSAAAQRLADFVDEHRDVTAKNTAQANCNHAWSRVEPDLT